jgi:hypothetical protein
MRVLACLPRVFSREGKASPILASFSDFSSKSFRISGLVVLK